MYKVFEYFNLNNENNKHFCKEQTLGKARIVR